MSDLYNISGCANRSVRVVVAAQGPPGPQGPQGPAGADGTSYVLPVASGGQLGGVRIGAGLGIDGNGVLSANVQSVSWVDVTGKPSFATVATTGSYSDLANVPVTFAPSAHTHTTADITGFAEAVDDRVASLLVAGSNIGISYNDVANTLTISATAGLSSFNTRTGAVTLTSTDVTTALGFSPAQEVHTHAVATTGAAGFMSAADKTKLDGITPYSLPSASTTVLGGVMLDGVTTNVLGGKLVATAYWDDVVNKPNLALVAETGAYSDLSGIPSTFAPAAHNQAWSTITSTPTTRSGYGITDAAGLGANTFTGTQSLGGNIVSQARLQSYRETVVNLGTLSTSGSFSAGTLTLDYSLGNVFKFTRDAAISAITLTNLPASGVLASVTLRMKANGTTYAVTYPNGTIKRNGANPTLTNTNGQENHITLTTDDAGTTFTLYDGGIYY